MPLRAVAVSDDLVAGLQLRVAFGQRQLTDEWTLDQDARHPPGWFADP